MKRLLLPILFLAFAFIAQGQNGKPTKEETAEYIVNTLKEYIHDFRYDEGGNGYYENQSLTFDNFILTLKFKMQYLSADVRHLQQFIINLKEIEKIELISSSQCNFLVFTSYNSKKLIHCNTTSTHDGFTKDEKKEVRSQVSFASPDDEKLVKAFNYLRKLCGAPEPIQF